MNLEKKESERHIFLTVGKAWEAIILALPVAMKEPSTALGSQLGVGVGVVPGGTLNYLNLCIRGTPLRDREAATETVNRTVSWGKTGQENGKSIRTDSASLQLYG